MVRIGKMLPGELEGDINPEDYGIEVIKIEEPTGKEAAEEIGKLYREAREISGIADPKLEKYIGELATGAKITKKPRGFKLRLRKVA